MAYKVLDLFGGAGGFSQGFRSAGYTIVGAVEWDKHAMASHQYNFPGTVDHLGDITKISDEEIVKNWGNKGVDVIISGPSCQAFSNANRREDRYSDEAISKNKLFFEVLRFAKVLNPRVVIIENVPQILTRDNGYAKTAISDYLKDLGYTTVSKVLLASDYGVPEHRKRAIFIGIKGDIEFNFDDLEVKPLVTVKDALSDLYEAVTQEEGQEYPCEAESDYQKLMRKDSDELRQHTISLHNQDVIDRLASIPQGGNWRDIPSHLCEGLNFKEGVTHSNNYRRLSESEASHTVTSKIDAGHPTKARRLSIREAARLQSFPDDFTFIGPRAKQALQIGNAVPPLMSQAIAEALLNYLDGKVDVKEEVSLF